MGEQVCSHCKMSRDMSFFQGKNDKSFKQCKSCRDEGKLNYKRKKDQENKENYDINHIEIYNSKEMSIALNALIYSVGQEEYIENFDKGIAFIQTITREDCNGTLKITININSNTANIELYHDLIHDRPEKINVTQKIKDFIRNRLQHTPAEIFNQLEIDNPNFTQKQCHFWWTELIRKEFQKDADQLKSSLILLEENNKRVIMQDIIGDVKYFAFITPFFDKLMHNQEILIDATCKYKIYLIFYYLLKILY